MATKSKAKRQPTKQRVLPPGSGTEAVPFWWPVQIPYMPPVGMSADTWWRMCSNAIVITYNSCIS